MPQPEWKTVPLTGAKVSADGMGSLIGYASTFGNVDSYGDTIQPGAYTAHLADFVDNGFIAWSHDWECMIGTISGAKQDATGLLITADFHSTPEAQNARTIAAERLARGKSMGLSIGYIAHKWAMQDMPGMDTQVRVLQDVEVFETSLVAIPADSYAGVTGIKSHPLTERPTKFWTVPGFKPEPTPEPAPEPEPDPGPTEDDHDSTERFADQFERVLLDVSALATRAADISDLRAKSGRQLSEANRRRLQGLVEQLTELLSATEPAPTTEEEDPAKATREEELARSFARLDSLAAIYAPPPGFHVPAYTP